jgi:malonyl-CoA O-methyltransferase
VRREVQQHVRPNQVHGGLSLSLEVIHGHAAKAPPKVPIQPTTKVSVEAMRAMLRPNRAED